MPDQYYCNILEREDKEEFPRYSKEISFKRISYAQEVGDTVARSKSP